MMKIAAAIPSFFLVLSLYAAASNPNHNNLASLPAAAQSSISTELGRDLPSYRVRAHGVALEAKNAQQKLTADFTATGLAVHTSNTTWKLALRGYGRSGNVQPVDEAAPQSSGNRVEYQRGPLTEWYVNGPLGLEQGFTLRERPRAADATHDSHAGMTPLIFALALSGDLTATVDQSCTGLILTGDSGQPELRYAGLSASDASGKQVRAWMEIQGRQLLLKVEDADARYPIVLDPFVQLAKLTPSDGVHLGFFGASVAISGNTVAVGMADTSLPGAVYVFEKPASGWSNMTQTAKLTASDGTANDYLGYSVAISGDTVVAGAPNSHNYQGGAYVFVKPASGWVDMTETTELNGSSTYQGFGVSVAMSGNTLVVGASFLNYDQPGSVFVYVKPASGWINAAPKAKLTPTNVSAYTAFATCVGISGNTVVAGAQNGKVYVFVEPTTGWANMTQTAWLAVPGDAAGFSVAISGNTIVTGSPYATIGSNYAQGAAYVFVRPANGWTNMAQTATLTASDGAANNWFGYGVAISGNRIVAGAPFASTASQGAAYAFQKPTTGWKTTSHFDAKVIASDGANGDDFGSSVAVSGNMLLVGAPGATSQHGTAYLSGP